jgi:hypothetical protein
LLALGLEVADAEAEAVALALAVPEGVAVALADAEVVALVDEVDVAEGVPEDENVCVSTSASTAPTRTTPAIGP